MGVNAHEQMVEAIAVDMERQLNTGHRVYAVDRASLSRLYAALGSAVGVNVEYPEPRIARGDR